MSESLEGERSVSAVANKKPWFTPAKKAAMIGVGTVLFVGFVFWKNPGAKKEEDATAAPALGIGQNVQYDSPKPQPMPAQPGVVSAPPPVTAPAPQSPMTQQTQQFLPSVRPVGSPVAPPVEKQRLPRMLSYATEGGGGTDGGEGGGGHGGHGRGDTTSVTFKGAPIVGAKAGAALDGDLLLMPGVIGCILDTAIDSTLPGPLMCHLDKPVISDSGVVLMSKGTRIIGNYSNEVKQGQGRLMAVSATAWTPEHIPVPLGGPFADSLGRAGIDGNVDNHYAERFGGAVLLSLGQSAMSVLQSSVSKSGGNSYVSLSQGGGVTDLAQEVLRNTINIPPTITAQQGSEISLWVLTPIDFSGALRLRAK